MLNKINTKKKLLLFPTLFVIIVVLVGIIYSHWSNISNTRSEATTKTDVFVQDVLKGRISVYQFLRAPNDKTAQKVRDDFSLLNSKVESFKQGLSLEKNRVICDEIISNSKKYIEYFDAFAVKRIQDFNNGIKDETPELKAIISNMVKVGLTLDEINASAIELKNDSNDF